MQEDKPPDDTTKPDTVSTRRMMLQAAAGLGALGLGTTLESTQAAYAASARFALPPASQELTPFQVAFPQESLDDLKRRLATTRWPEKETVADWSQGVPLAKMRALVDYWRSGYDLHRLERRLNAIPQYRTQIDGLGIHFLHVRSKHPNALPIVLTHGWPGSVVEFLEVIEPLTDPEAHGGTAEDAFHVVIPSLPGYGFSDRPTEKGWNLPRIAEAWGVLMKRLGYTRWCAQGGDWGAGVATWLGKHPPAGLAAIHLNLPILFPPPIQGEPNAAEKAAIGQLMAFDAQRSAYAKIQTTRPQTLGYGLHDSPVGQAAWIYEKFGEWTDSNYQPERALSLDAMLDNITLYWLTGTATSAARLYAESFATEASRQLVDIPVGVSLFPGELYHPPKLWAERTYSQLFYWNEVSKGGHFAAFEQPQLFTAELRACFAKLRAKGASAI